MGKSGDGEEWFEIFRTGAHTDSAGNISDWTDQDLDEIVSLYDPTIHEAPIVLGHPEHDSPAYGWIEAIKRVEDKLLAKPRQLVEEFKNMIRKGSYKKVSIALYPDLGLRHVGFLGGMTPAIKGLKQAAFGEKKAKWVIESDFFMEPWQHETIKSIFQRMRDWMIDKFSLEEADKIISPYDIEALKYEPATTVGAIHESPSFSDKPNKPADAKALADKGGKNMDLKKFFSDLSALITGAQKELVPDSAGSRFTEEDVAAAEKRGKDAMFAENEKLKKEKADLEKEKAEAAAKVKEIEIQKRKDDIMAFCESLCKEGKLTPALRKIIEPIMIHVGAIHESPVIEFAEGVKKPALDGIKDFLTELPKVVIFREVTPSSGPGAGGSAAEKLSALTKQKMEAKKDLSYAIAFSEVQKENPELAKEYSEEVRPKK